MLRLLWSGCRVETLCEELAGLGLVTDHRLDPPGPRLVLHDVMRCYLQTRRSAPDQAQVHRRLIVAAAELLPASEETRAPWWLLPGVDPPTAVMIVHAIILTALGTFCAGLAGFGWPGSVQLLSVKAADGVNPHGC